MSKNKETRVSHVDIGRGVIQDNAYAALVTSKLFKSKVEKAKKGKGSFTRKVKHAGREPYLIAV